MGGIGILRLALALVAWTGLSVLALADDWMVDRLRGDVLVMTGGSWSPLQRGDIVSDSSRIRSGEGSRVTFTRGAEAIELSGATEIRIFDAQGERMTTIMQAYGTVTVEAERLQIQHFSVQTPFLAAIVKGTRFTVHSDDTQSSVDVSRGLVQVQDYVHGVATDITPGQSAVVSDAIVLDVSGRGAMAPRVTLDGQLLSPANERALGAQCGGQACGGMGAPNGNAGHGIGNSGQGNSGQGNGNNGQNNGSNGQGNNGNNGNGNSGQNNGNGGQGNGGNGGQGNGGNGGQGNGGNGGQGNGGQGNGSNGGQGNGGQGNASQRGN